MEKYTGETKVKMRNSISCMIKVMYVLAVCVFALNVKPSRFAENIGLVDVQAGWQCDDTEWFSEYEYYWEWEDEEKIEIDNVTWGYEILSDGSVSIVYCNSSDSQITIPKEIDGAVVSTIGYYAFRKQRHMTGVIIPDSVTNIGDYAFSWCRKLTSIEIPAGVTSIGKGAFFRCEGLGSIEIPVGVTSIGDSVFSNCYILTSIKMPAGVTSIGNNAFTYCEGLTSIEIPTGVESIGNGAFFGCSGLTNIEIPAGITSIGNNAFTYCEGLTSIEIPAGVTSIGNGIVSGCKELTEISVDVGNVKYEDRNSNVIMEKETKTLIAGCNNSQIPKDIERIEEGVFLGCSNLTDIEIPAGLISIGGEAFSGCSGLTSIEIPAGVTSIGESAFVKCSGLERIEVNSGNPVYRSEENALIEKETGTLILGCKNTVIPAGVTGIGSHAFDGCSGSISIKIPDSMTSIGNAAFQGFSGLTSIEIPKSITSIEAYAFYGCTGLKDVYYEGTESEWKKISITYEEYTGATDVECNQELRRANIHYESTMSGELNPTPQPNPQPEDKPQQPATPAPAENKIPVTNTTPVKAENGSQVKTSDKGTATLTTAAPSDKKTVSIPSVVMYGGVEYDITEIGANAFKNLKKATTISLPKTVKKIDANAFSKSKIKTVKLTVSKGQKLTIDKKAFKNSKVQKVQITVSKKATAKEIKALKSALKKAGIKEKNIKISKKLK